MSRIAISGVEIEYELLGTAGAQAIAITPGGRLSKDAPGIRELAEAVAAGGKRVLIWDRPNCGASDVCFTGESESRMQGEILIRLIRALGLGPTALAGGSAGARTCFLAASYDPGAISHLIPWWISGGTLSLLALGAAYCSEPAVVASLGGMEAVAKSPGWAELIARNPRNRALLLAQNPEAFIATMRRWAEAFVPSPTAPIPGLTQTDITRLRMPMLIFRSSVKDLYHPADMTELAHKIFPHSKLIDPPWNDAQFVARITTPNGHFLDWPKLAPAILDFISK